MLRGFALLCTIGVALPGLAQDEARRGTAAAPPGESAARPAPGPAVDENDDNDNAARRARVNATAKLELAAGTMTVLYPLLPADGPDAAAIATLDDGEVLELTRSMALKLKTEVELRFEGGAVARPGNVAAGYAGVYSLWLRRAGDGWRLVLNREPDVWGTMRDPAADVGETALIHRRLPDAEAKSTLGAALVATNGGGELTLLWGTDHWTARFDAGPGMAAVSTGKGGAP
jgi:hypothetical protein